MFKSRKWNLILITPGLAGLIIFWIIPLIAQVYYSFTAYFDHKFTGLDNMVQLFRNKIFLMSMKNTLFLTIILVVVTIILSFILAYWIWTSKLSKQLISFIVVPIIIPTTVVSFTWELIFGNSTGINSLINGLGFNSVNFQSNALVVVQVTFLYMWKYIGLGTIILISSFETTQRELSEVYYLDSKKVLGRIRHVIIPQIIPKIVFLLYILFMFSFNISQDITTLWGSYPPNNLYTLQNFINNNFMKLNYEMTSSAANIIVVFACLVIFVLSGIERRYQYD